MIKFIILSILFLGFVTSCHSKNETDGSQRIYKIETTAKDIRIPKIVFENIISDLKQDGLTSDPVFLFHTLDVVLESESGQIPVSTSKYQFTNGGGEIDLKNIIKGIGSFYFYFPKDQFEKLPELEHLYFISEYPKKNIDHEIFGIGCGTWVDLKKKYSDFTKKSIKLNTTDQRYLFVAAGYYVFVFRKNNQVYLTHLHLTDSNFSNLKCPNEIDTKSEVFNERNGN